jgi:hypothetical protein
VSEAGTAANDLVENITSTAGSVVESVVPTVINVADSAAGLVDDTGTAVDKVVDSVVPTVTSVTESAPELVDHVVETVAPVVGSVVPTVATVADKAIDTVSDTLATATNVVEPVVTSVASVADKTIDTVGDALGTATAAVEPVVSTVEKIAEPIPAALDTAADTVDSLADSVQPVLTAASDSLSGLDGLLKVGGSEPEGNPSTTTSPPVEPSSDAPIETLAKAAIEPVESIVDGMSLPLVGKDSDSLGSDGVLAFEEQATKQTEGEELFTADGYSLWGRELMNEADKPAAHDPVQPDAESSISKGLFGENQSDHTSSDQSDENDQPSSLLSAPVVADLSSPLDDLRSDGLL